MLKITSLMKQTNDQLDGLQEIIESTSKIIIYLMMGLCFLAVCPTILYHIGSFPAIAWSVSSLAFLSLFIGLRLMPGRYLIGTLLWQIGVLVSVLLAAILFKRGELLFFLTFLPLITVVTLGRRWGLLLAALTIGASLVISWRISPGIVDGVQLSLIVVGAMISFSVGSASQFPLSSMMEWYLYSYRNAQKNLEETRQHRAELARINQQMERSNIQLEKANQMLILARADAEEARQAIHRFTLAISHEFRTPLNFIIGFSEIMVNHPESYEPLERWPEGLYEEIQEIYKSSQHLSRLVNDVLDLGKLEELQVVLEREPINIIDIIRDVEQMVQRAFERKSIQLIIRCEPDLPQINVDRLRIRQVLLNLINNALKFTDQGSVTLEVTQPNTQSLLVRITDTGSGIAPEDMDKIFTEFAQLQKESRHRKEGTGLGLPISKQFIEMHGGSIWADSQPGAGTTFSFTLPISAASALDLRTLRSVDESSWHMMERNALKSQTVLVVSGKPNNRDAVIRLTDHYTPIFSDCVDAAVEQIRTNYPIAVLVDLSTVGKTALKNLLQRLAYNLPVICFPFPEKIQPEEDLPGCVKAYLVKPISSQGLNEVILSINPQIRKVLVIDSDPTMKSYIARSLEVLQKNMQLANEIEVIPASSGQEGIQKLEEKPDIIILDIQLPDMESRKLLDTIQRKAIPAIILTAYEYHQLKENPRYSRFEVLTDQPLSRNELKSLLTACLENLHPDYPDETDPR